jgi:alkylated DNA repair protein alkB family protein 7
LAVGPDDFCFYPNFASAVEQRALLSSGLAKLDRTLSSPEARKRRRPFLSGVARDGFLAPEAYVFERSHFDGVIDRYRECSLTSFPASDDPTLDAALDGLLRRLYATFFGTDAGDTAADPKLVPPRLVAHLLHLAPDGAIRPHVDNVDASAGTIVGLSLGSTRVLRLRADGGADAAFEVALPPGSAYVQRCGRPRCEVAGC